MRDLESCVNKKELGWILDKLNHLKRMESKINALKYLKDKREYKCYFCDGFNRDCNKYLSYVDRFVGK